MIRARAGRGPTKARTTILSDLIVVTLSDSLTQAEKTLVENGDDDLAARLRDAVYEAMRAEAIATIHELTGRPVQAYLTDQHLDPDVAIVAFSLGPRTPLQAA